MAPNHSAILVASPCLRSRITAYTNARMAPRITVSSSTGRVQFSRANGLRSSTRPPASAQEKPRRSASCSNVGAHRSDTGCLLVGVGGDRIRGVPLRDVVSGVETIEPLPGQCGQLFVFRIVAGDLATHDADHRAGHFT